MSDTLLDLGAYIGAKRPDGALNSTVTHGELTLTVPLAQLEGLVEFLKSDPACRFTTLVDITAIDHPERAARFDMVYHFLSMYKNHRIRLKVAVRADDMVPSIHSIHPSANWFEREVFDMFGQGLNLLSNGGFLSIEFSSDWFERVLSEMPIIVARRDICMYLYVSVCICVFLHVSVCICMYM